MYNNRPTAELLRRPDQFGPFFGFERRRLAQNNRKTAPVSKHPAGAILELAFAFKSHFCSYQQLWF